VDKNLQHHLDEADQSQKTCKPPEPHDRAAQPAAPTSDFSERKGYRRPKFKESELIQIKRKLGLKQSAPFRKCPAIVARRIQAFEAAGNYDHSDKDHSPCAECGCRRTSGEGTDHFGWGWCEDHERGRRKGHAKRFAENDLTSQQQRHPRAFRNAQNFISLKVKTGDEADAEFDLLPELVAVKNSISEFFNYISEWEKSNEERGAMVDAVIRLTDALKEAGPIDPEQAQGISDALDTIVRKMTIPLTEKSGKGVIPMTDGTRIKLMADVFDKLGSGAKRVQELRNISSLSFEEYSRWLRDVLNKSQKTFGSQTFDNKGEAESIIEMIGQIFFECGDPNKGK